jgi:hypothetical protein
MSIRQELPSGLSCRRQSPKVKPRLGGRRRRRRAGDGTAGGEEVLDAVHLDVEPLELPLALVLRGRDDGDTADLLLLDGGVLLEGGVPDEGDLVAVPGANTLDNEGKGIGLRSG